MKQLVTSAFIVGMLLTAASLIAADDKPAQEAAEPQKSVVIGGAAPEFQIKDSRGELIDLTKLAAKGPVLVRLTCGCSGCDKELAYFQEIHHAYRDKGLTSLAVFREPDAKVEAYVKQKKLNMLYAVDTKGESWNTFQTKKMPTNFLIDKGGKIISIAEGCDTSGLLANALSKKVATLLDTDAVDVQQTTVKNEAATPPATK
jgi:peroxiredoxin